MLEDTAQTPREATHYTMNDRMLSEQDDLPRGRDHHFPLHLLPLSSAHTQRPLDALYQPGHRRLLSRPAERLRPLQDPLGRVGIEYRLDFGRVLRGVGEVVDDGTGRKESGLEVVDQVPGVLDTDA